MSSLILGLVGYADHEGSGGNVGESDRFALVSRDVIRADERC